MKIQADEIRNILRQQIEGYKTDIDIAEVGTVLSVGDGIARIYGLEKAMAMELIEFPNDVFGIVMVGNFDVDVEQQQRIGHLLSPLPPEMRNDTAFQDRIHAFAPGWNFPKLHPNLHLTSHFGLVSDFLSECLSRMRQKKF